MKKKLLYIRSTIHFKVLDLSIQLKGHETPLFQLIQVAPMNVTKKQW